MSKECTLERYVSFESNYHVPRSKASCIAMAEDHCCTAEVFQINETKEVWEAASKADVYSFIPSCDTNCHRKHLQLRVVTNHHSQEFTLKYRSPIRRIKVISLPTSNELVSEQQRGQNCSPRSQTFGILLVVATEDESVSVQSIVLQKRSDHEDFRISESINVSKSFHDILVLSRPRSTSDLDAYISFCSLMSMPISKSVMTQRKARRRICVQIWFSSKRMNHSHTAKATFHYS